jgi:hypothetical protein
MALSIDPQSAVLKDIDTLKRHLKSKEFGMIAAAGHETCLCGRIPSALDVVVTALKQGIHGKALVRDTLLGAQNIWAGCSSTIRTSA